MVYRTHHYLYPKINVETKYLKVCSSKNINDQKSFSLTFEEHQAKDEGAVPGLKLFKVQVRPNQSNEKSGSVWIAKMGYYEEELNKISLAQDESLNPCSLALRTYNYLPILEKISSDCYDLLSQDRYIVPKTKLAKMPIQNTYTSDSPVVQKIIKEINQNRFGPPIDELVYFLSKEVDKYTKFENIEVINPETNDPIPIQRFIAKFKRPPEKIIDKENGEIPLVGHMEVLAIARIINDIDVLGTMLSNIGYVITQVQGKGTVAKVVKIDPGLLRTGHKSN